MLKWHIFFYLYHLYHYLYHIKDWLVKITNKMPIASVCGPLHVLQKHRTPGGTICLTLSISSIHPGKIQFSFGTKLFVKTHLMRLKLWDQYVVLVSVIDIVVVIMLCAIVSMCDVCSQNVSPALNFFHIQFIFPIGIMALWPHVYSPDFLRKKVIPSNLFRDIHYQKEHGHCSGNDLLELFCIALLKW